eukprot:GHVO01009674.1.p1 GENE.GHVO01009674.1~~GHVO01009674.1.p1  ORF type:complete len:395 (+),score=57.15 GHVO01009674.1:491-1675(+)
MRDVYRSGFRMYDTACVLSEFDHENMSIQIFESLYERSPILEENFPKDMVAQVKSMIRGVPENHPYKSIDPRDDLARAALDIVCNQRNGIDVDKFDYLIRDGTIADGLPRFSPDRLINWCNVIGSEICFNRKEKSEVSNLFNCRERMFENVYTHRKVRGFELTLCDALLEADPVFKFSDMTLDVNQFMSLDDTAIDLINRPLSLLGYDSDQEGRIKTAQGILRRVVERCPYRLVGALKPTRDLLSYEKLRKVSTSMDIVSCQLQDGTAQLSEHDIIVDENTLQYGDIDNVSYYDPGNEYKKFKIPREGPPTSPNTTFRVFCRPDGDEMFRAAKTAFIRWTERNDLEDMNNILSEPKTPSRSQWQRPRSFSPGGSPVSLGRLQLDLPTSALGRFG